METYINDEGTVNDELKNLDSPEQGSIEPTDPDHLVRKKYHSSALYAASMWHGTVKHVKPPHSGGGLLPTQA